MSNTRTSLEPLVLLDAPRAVTGADGLRLVVHDISPELLPLLACFTTPLPARAPEDRRPRPSWSDLRTAGTGLGAGWRQRADAELWAAHAVALTAWRAGTALPLALSERGRCSEPSLLALKAELARRAASPCHLCTLHCGARRRIGEVGPCGAGAVTRFGPVLQIVEEFGQGVALSPTGCNARCTFCSAPSLLSGRAGQVLSPHTVARRSAAAAARNGEALPGPIRLAGDVDVSDAAVTEGAVAQYWVGGNPDQQVPFLLATLLATPRRTPPLPVVWTANGGASAEAMALLNGVVGAYTLTLRFGDGACAARLGAPLLRLEGCARTVERALRQASVTLARVLALPDHLDCCTLPVLTWLAGAQRRRPDLLVSLLDHQYEPSYRARRDPALGRPLTAEERARVDRAAADLGLNRLDGEAAR